MEQKQEIKAINISYFLPTSTDKSILNEFYNEPPLKTYYVFDQYFDLILK